MTSETHERPKVTVPDLARMKALEEKITMITAYDATFARLVDLAGVDMILVGDTVGMVVQGEANTIPVDARRDGRTTCAWCRGPSREALIVGDLPFGSLPGQPAAGGRELDPADEGRRRVRQARRRRGDGRDDPGHHPRRHPGGRPHRPHAAELPPHGRPQGAGREERLRGRRPRAPARRMRTPSSRPVRAPWWSRACPSTSPPRSPRSCRSRRSASAPARLRRPGAGAARRARPQRPRR